MLPTCTACGLPVTVVHENNHADFSLSARSQQNIYIFTFTFLSLLLSLSGNRGRHWDVCVCVGGGGVTDRGEGLHQRSRKKGVASAPTSVCHVSVFACRKKISSYWPKQRGKVPPCHPGCPSMSIVIIRVIGRVFHVDAFSEEFGRSVFIV